MLEYRSQLSNLSIKQIFRNVEFSFEQMARLCGVSRRQLSYWIQQGFVPAPDTDPFATIERAELIRIRLENGDTLRHALQKVAEYYSQHEEAMQKMEGMSDEERGQWLIGNLEVLQARVTRLRQVIDDPSTPVQTLWYLTTVLRYLALNELLTMLPHSHPTPDLIMRVRQSAANLEVVLQGLETSRESQAT